MLDDFLSFLYGDNMGKVYVPTLLKIKDENGDRVWEKRHFFWPANRQAIKDHIEGSADRGDVYICPSLFKANNVKKEGFKSSNVVWVDFDGNYTGNFRGLPQPNLVVQSSVGNRAHCYWKLDHTNTDSVLLEDLNKRLAIYLETDDSGWDCTQLLRPPGTINHKRELPVHVVSLQGEPVPLNEFDFLQKIELTKVNHDPIEFPEVEELLKGLSSPDQ